MHATHTNDILLKYWANLGQNQVVLVYSLKFDNW